MQGIWPIQFACFDAQDRLDREAMRIQTLCALESGAPGVAVLGLATEVDKLSLDERQALIAWLAEDLDGELPFAVTISGVSIAEQRALAGYAIGQGARYLILQPPSVGSLGRQTPQFYFDFFAAVMEELPAGSGGPVTVGIQNAPEYLGVGLTPDALAALAALRPDFGFVKGEGSSTVIERTIARLGVRLPVLNGRGGLELIENLQAGCSGMIVAPDSADAQLRVYELFRAGRLPDAHTCYARILPEIVFVMQSLDTLVCYGKRIAAWRMGFEVEYDRAPALRPTEFGLRMARQHADRLGPISAAPVAPE